MPRSPTPDRYRKREYRDLDAPRSRSRSYSPPRRRRDDSYDRYKYDGRSRRREDSYDRYTRGRSRSSRSPSRRDRRSDRSIERRDRGRGKYKSHSRSKSPSYRRRHSSEDDRRRRRRDEKEKEEDESVEEDGEENIDEEEDEETKMMKLMGFGGFDTTKNKKVPGADVSGAKIRKPLKYRQYMNRRGGFNRPLDG